VGALFLRVLYQVFLMIYSVLCIDDQFDTCSVTEHSSLDAAQKEAQELHREYPDVRIELHDDSGFLSEVK